MIICFHKFSLPIVVGRHSSTAAASNRNRNHVAVIQFDINCVRNEIKDERIKSKISLAIASSAAYEYHWPIQFLLWCGADLPPLSPPSPMTTMTFAIQFQLCAADCDGRCAVIFSMHRTALPDDCHSVGRFRMDTIDEWHWSQTLLNSIQSFLQSIWDYRMESRAKLALAGWLWLPSRLTKTIEWHNQTMRFFPAYRSQLAAHCYAVLSMFPIWILREK